MEINVPSQVSSHEECNILSVMSKQNEFTSLLIQQHGRSSLPKGDPSFWRSTPVLDFC